MTHHTCTLWGPACLRGGTLVIIGIWVASGAREMFQDGGVPPPFRGVFRAPGAAQIPNMADLQSSEVNYCRMAGVYVPHRSCTMWGPSYLRAGTSVIWGSGRPRGPGRSFRNMGYPHVFWRVSRALGIALSASMTDLQSLKNSKFISEGQACRCRAKAARSRAHLV